MSAYNKVNGQYCGQNVHLLHDIAQRIFAGDCTRADGVIAFAHRLQQIRQRAQR